MMTQMNRKDAITSPKKACMYSYSASDQHSAGILQSVDCSSRSKAGSQLGTNLCDSVVARHCVQSSQLLHLHISCRTTQLVS